MTRVGANAIATSKKFPPILSSLALKFLGRLDLSIRFSTREVAFVYLCKKYPYLVS